MSTIRDPEVLAGADGRERTRCGDAARLMQKVVRGGYCIGCGACAVTKGSPLKISMDPYGRYVADWAGTGRNDEMNVAGVCPFMSDNDEDGIAERIYADAPNWDGRIGRYRANYAGHVVEGDYRARGSSGGMAKWILAESLRTGMVDAVIQAAAVPGRNGSGTMYRMEVMRTPDQVRGGSKSAYYPVEMSAVLREVMAREGRYAIAGLPCFIKAVRLLAMREPEIAERVQLTVGLVCGHLKSARYGEMLAWQLGAPPGIQAHVDFRKKLPGRKANEKGIEVRILGSAAGARTAPVRELFGGAYNLGLFQYRACDYCDDVLGETADVSVGDAWLPEYVSDGQGTSIVVVRQRHIGGLIESGKRSGRLKLDEISAERVAESQAGGLRQRREGLAYRLALADRGGVWRPRKRVKASEGGLTRQRRRIYEMRVVLAERSHEIYERARREGNFEIFREEMGRLIAEYERVCRGGIAARLRRWAARQTRRLRLLKNSKSG